MLVEFVSCRRPGPCQTAAASSTNKQALHQLGSALSKCEELRDAELLERLTAIKGIGRRTVEMLLLLIWAGPTCCRSTTLGVRKGFQLAYRKRQLPEPQYLWRAADMLGCADW